MHYSRAFTISLIFVLQLNWGQKPQTQSPASIYHAVQKLNFLGTALYVAAHPDDENTRLISYLSNQVKARTAYLSLTRGDGGQNLIGPELRELLGVLRTQELLAARNIDGGEQFFSRANDFGYSKHPDETLAIWDKEVILGDVVGTMRKFKPDIVINRFDHRSPGATHGHHTSSAMLSVEAFAMAKDPKAYPAQLETLQPWQPKRIFFNTSWWFYGSEEKFKAADKSNMLAFDVGIYYPMLGVSNNEIASLASSQHLCQGFGRITSRGSEKEYIELLHGDFPVDKNDLFYGIDTSWSRINGGEAIGDILYTVQENFNFKNPIVHLPQLLEAYELLQKVDDDYWKPYKSQELIDIITALCGLHMEALASSSSGYPGAQVPIKLEVLKRVNTNITIQSIAINNKKIITKPIILADNKMEILEYELPIPQTTKYTAPYWLMEEGTLGNYKVKDKELIGKPETPRAFNVTFNVNFNGTVVPITKPIIYKYARPDKGELYEPFEIVPEATVAIQDKVLIFADSQPKKIAVTVKAHRDSVSGTVTIATGDHWSLEQQQQPFSIAKKNDEQVVFFTLAPPEMESQSTISASLDIEGKKIDKEMVNIAYDHVPTQTVLLPATAKVVRLDIQKAGEHIGYIMGAGDEVPKSLEQIGYTVQLIDPAAIAEGTLDKYDAVVLGIRAYNVLDELKFKQKFILDYAEKGGNVIVQYNTASRWNSQFENIAPYALHISNDRVTDEHAQVGIIAKNHSVVNFPNTINSSDFDGWVQERGLYFPDSWETHFTPIFEMNDKGETPKKGSLLVAPYGKGNYIYTGLSFFRELPAGVPGAYKLFTNLLSIGKKKVISKEQIKG